MPYIKPERQVALNNEIKALSDKISSRGELNYALTCLVLSEIRGISYEELASLVGDIECIKQEFIRRLLIPYEENKRRENGDIFFPNNKEARSAAH